MKYNFLLFAIKSIFAEKILSGEKTIELRRVCPINLKSGDMIAIYSSGRDKAIVGVCKVRNVIKLGLEELWERSRNEASISKNEFSNYFYQREFGYGIEIFEVKKLTRPVSLDDLKRVKSFVVPQNFRYLNPSRLEDSKIRKYIKESL